MNPFLRWAGSKRQLLGKLTRFWTNEASRYVEPFCGSACLFFHLEPKSAILGDLNRDLTITYNALRNDAALVCDHLQKLPLGKEAYYSIRSNPSVALRDEEVAARFLYLNRFCFNGIYRTNLKGEFNVPYGPPRSNATFNYDAILNAATLLKRATILNCDFQTTLSKAKANDFVYLDPPYAVAERRIFAQYHPQTFSLNDLCRLNDCLNELHRKRAFFVVSYADSKEARKLLNNWNPRRVWTKRHVAGFAGHRRGAYELLATNIPEECYAS